MTGVSIVGVTADFLEVRDYEVGRGRFFTAAEKRCYPACRNSRCRHR